MFTRKVPSHKIPSPYNLFCKLNNPPISRSRTRVYAKYKREFTPRETTRPLPNQHIPHNTLIARPPSPTNTSPTRILNPIPLENIEKFNITFFEEKSAQPKALTTLLENHQHLTPNQWQEACTSFDYIVNKISEKKIEKTCTTYPLPNLMYKTSQQGGFLPRKLVRGWKTYFTTYHLIRKAIYIAQHDPHWQAHPILNDIRNHQHVSIPHPPVTTARLVEWIDAIATIAKKCK